MSLFKSKVAKKNKEHGSGARMALARTSAGTALECVSNKIFNRKRIKHLLFCTNGEEILFKLIGSGFLLHSDNSFYQITPDYIRYLFI